MSVTLDPVRGVAEAMLRHYLPAPEKPPRRWATPGAMAMALDKSTRTTPALDLIDRELLELADGDTNKLMIFIPPQEGKSQKVSRRFPAWLLAHDPTLRIGIVSYSDGKAARWGRQIRRDIQAHPELDITLRADSRAAGRWETEQGGGLICVGIGGGITGEPIDCLRGDTRILTESGYARIADIHRSGQLPRVLSFNHAEGRAEWRPVVATREIADRELVEVVTTSGRRITCTPDHRIYVNGRGYVPAADLQPGERLLTADDRPDQVRPVWSLVHQTSVNAMEDGGRSSASLFPCLPGGIDNGEHDLRGMRQGVHATSGRRGEGQTTGLRTNVLHEGMLPLNGVRRSRGRAASLPGPSGGRVALAPDHGLDGADLLRQAAVLQARDRGAVRRSEQTPGLHRVRHGQEVQECHLPTLLSSGTGVDVDGRTVLTLRYRVPAHARRGREEEASWPGSPHLFAQMQRRLAVRAERTSRVPSVQRALRWWQGPEVLHAEVQEGGATPAQGEELPALPQRVHLLQQAAAVLLKGMRRRSALASDDRYGELPLQGRDQLRRGVPPYAAAHPGAGPDPVQGVWSGRLPDSDCSGQVEVGAADSSPQRGPGGQPAGESDHALPAVSRDPSQVGHDTVHMVRRLHGERDSVYDLQVEGNHNFFADQVLVHNCLIIDDPVRGRAEAESATYREAAWDWWESNGSTRESSRSKVILMMTRWHEDDLAGRLLKNEPGDWKVVSIPAIAGKDITVKGGDGAEQTVWVHDGPDPLGRQPGEELQSVQGRKLGHFLRLFRVRSSYVWRSVFQQQPVSAEGNLFRRSAFRYWHRMPADTERHGMLGGQRVDCDGGRVVYLDDCWRFATVDLAASTKTSADYTVGAAWAISPDGDLILLDRVRARVSDADHWGLIRPLLGKWVLDTVFVEQSFITATFVIDGTAAGVPIQPVTADTDKLTRALPATTRIKAGRVMFPAGADWLDEWCDELAAFPSGTHDDQVDTLSYAARVVAAHWLRADTSSYGTQHRGTRADEGVIGSAYEAATGHHPNGMNYMDIPM